MPSPNPALCARLRGCGITSGTAAETPASRDMAKSRGGAGAGAAARRKARRAASATALAATAAGTAATAATAAASATAPAATAVATAATAVTQGACCITRSDGRRMLKRAAGVLAPESEASSGQRRRARGRANWALRCQFRVTQEMAGFLSFNVLDEYLARSDGDPYYKKVWIFVDYVKVIRLNNGYAISVSCNAIRDVLHIMRITLEDI